MAKAGDLPLARDASVRFLPWLIAVMVFLMALALTTALALDGLVDRWRKGLSGEITVQLPAGEESGPTAEERLKSVLEMLDEQEGVVEVRLLTREESAGLLEPWLGESAYDEGLPLPTLIAVTLAEENPANLTDLRLSVQALAPEAEVDDHQRWLGEVARLMRMVQLAAGLILFLVALATITTVVFVTRTGLAVHQQIIELLHIMGARDSYIASQFQWHSLRLGLVGGLAGLVLALVTMALIAYSALELDAALLPALSLAPWQWALVVTLPAVSALIAMWTARWTVLKSLARLN